MAATTCAHLAVYILQCVLYPISIIATYYLISPSSRDVQKDDDIQGSLVFATVVFFIRFLPTIGIPKLSLTIIGLLINVKCYQKDVTLNSPPMLAPYICFRVVTRGDYPELVRQTVKRNIETCLSAGLYNFVVEVVTDTFVELPDDIHIREIIVPAYFVTQSGIKYKGRALQYCLEDGVNQLNDNDWIVHLDEESLLTENSVRGIINFVMDGEHPFGQGIVTYNSENVNEFLTLMDAARVSEDIGSIGGSFKLFHKPICGWKGSFMVCQAGAEKHVSFEFGLAGSVAEDCFFCLSAYKHGYTFNFIDGEILEKSPFTIADFVRQRKRWFEGKLGILFSSGLPYWCKVFIGLDVISWVSTPVLIFAPLLEASYTLPRWFWHDVLTSFVIPSLLFVYLYGVIKSHTLAPRKRTRKFVIQLVVGSLLVIPFYSACYTASIVWYVIGKKHTFEVIQKWNKKTAAENVPAHFECAEV